MKLKLVKLKPAATLPWKRAVDAGFDIYPLLEDDEEIIIRPGETKRIPTGIGCIIPKGCYIQVSERSSTSLSGLKISGGVIDQGYLGQIFILAVNVSQKPIIISHNPETALVENAVFYPAGKAVAQLILHKLPTAQIEEITLTEFASYTSARMDGAFGSTLK